MTEILENGSPKKKNTLRCFQDNSALSIRRAAKRLAQEAVEMQKNSFKNWAIAADWNNPYCTFDKEYVAQELRLFGRMYEKNLVYRAFMPVYW